MPPPAYLSGRNQYAPISDTAILTPPKPQVKKEEAACNKAGLSVQFRTFSPYLTKFALAAASCSIDFPTLFTPDPA